MKIVLDSNFEGGNGRLVELLEVEGRQTVRFAAEPKNCPETMWFYFHLEGLGKRETSIVLSNPHQSLGGADWSANRPVWRTEDEPWQRFGPADAVHRPDGLVEWAWGLPSGLKAADVAFCYPYLPADLETTLAETGDVFSVESIGLTFGSRDLPRVYQPDEGTKPVVYLTARSHSGETPGSWVLDGLLRHVAANEPLRRSLAFRAVPFVNLDDALAGSYGKDPFPHDANRAYHPVRRPENKAIVLDAGRLNAAKRLAFYCDLHAPAHAERQCYLPTRGWMIGAPINPLAEPFAEAFHQAVPEDIRSPVAHITPDQGSNSRYPGLNGSRWASEILEVPSITLETSYQGNATRDYTIDDYRRMGAALAETIVAWVSEHSEA